MLYFFASKQDRSEDSTCLPVVVFKLQGVLKADNVCCDSIVTHPSQVLKGGASAWDFFHILEASYPVNFYLRDIVPET